MTGNFHRQGLFWSADINSFALLFTPNQNNQASISTRNNAMAQVCINMDNPSWDCQSFKGTQLDNNLKWPQKKHNWGVFRFSVHGLKFSNVENEEKLNFVISIIFAHLIDMCTFSWLSNMHTKLHWKFYRVLQSPEAWSWHALTAKPAKLWLFRFALC